VNGAARPTSYAPSVDSLTGRALLASAWWMTGSNVVAQGFAYTSLILLARWLSPASFGTVAVGTAIVYFANLFVDAGTLGALVVAPRIDRADAVRAGSRCVVRALVLTAAMAALAPLLVDKFARGGDTAAMAALALCLPLSAVSVVPTALLQKSMHFRGLAGITAAANILSALSAVGLALAGFGVWALVARQLVLFALTAVISSAVCLRASHTGRLILQTAHMVDRSPNAHRWFLLFAFLTLATLNMDNLVVGASGSASLVGLYALAFTIAMAPTTQLAEPVGKVLSAAAALRPDSSAQRVEQSVRLMSLLLIPLLPVGILAAPWFLPTVLGSKWEPIVVPFQVLLAVGVGHAIVNCIGAVLSGNGQIAFRAKVMIVRCGVTLIGLLVLVRADGIRGAAMAQLVALVVYAAILVPAGSRRTGTSTRALWKALRPATFAILIQAIGAGAVLLVLGNTATAEVIAAAAVAIAAAVVYAPAVIQFYKRTRSS
jgi:O-antigen/teichoic acid export membrane protein